MAIRTKQETSWYQSKKPTLLDLPGQAGELALHNKVNPDTGKTQNLGTGGAGYGRFGKLGGHTRFVKKQKLKKNEQTAAAGVGTALNAQPQQIQDQNLAWIDEEMVKFRTELNVTTNLLNHPNVIKSYGGAVGIGKGGVPKAYLVMEMMAGGDLTKVIGNAAIDDTRKKAIMLDAISGLAHVHAAGLIHRDIKPENIMLNVGEAKPMDGNGEFITPVRAGTAGYYHPNIVAAAAANQPIHYSAATDLYALGKTFEKLVPVTPALNAWIAGLLVANDAAAAAAALPAIAIPVAAAAGGPSPAAGGPVPPAGGPGPPVAAH
ncbi:protein kinase [Sphingomonas sp. LY54]|uniref:protein kinase domain-containing protein n=1 Tax=Sphingomonas sp. LY54 TaxID=3095343 RepID=UPI002D766DB9|nr:protein kinase [Sphingomonas sp. LY54]WRP28240.1 protein kinase [Sphingomonas sp. LY54]